MCPCAEAGYNRGSMKPFPVPALLRAHDLMRRVASLENRVLAATTYFLKTDLEVGLTRARIAAQAKSGSAKRRRNIIQAKKASEAVHHFRNRTALSDDQGAAIDEGLARLDDAIRQYE